jgi:GntR family transcriptional regulator
MTLPITVDARDPMPLYAQLERGIRGAIATVRLAPGAQLPTVRQLAVDLKVNANTVAKVYLALERDGVLVTRRGVGTFVAETQPKVQAVHAERQMKTLAERFLTEAAALGMSPREAVSYLARRVKEGE